MNILFITQRIPYPANKGEKIRSFHQIKHLAEQKNNITVLSPYEDDEELAFAEQLSLFENISSYCIKLDSKIRRLLIGLLKNESLSVANFYSDRLQCEIDSSIKQSSFDAIICTSSAMAKYIFRSKSLKNMPTRPMLLMDFMDLDSDKWQQYANTSRWPMKWIYQREAKLLASYEQKITQAFDISFFIADAEVALFKAQVKSTGKVLTLGNGMDTEVFSPAPISPNNLDPVFLFTGVMDYKPNIDAVVWFVEEVWTEILNQYPKARFIIAGMNPTTQIEELKRSKGIEVTGFVDDILPYYHQADYFVAPFRLARGVQNKVLQGFACGLPVISTPMGAEGIDCEDDKSILIASTAQEFLKQINRLEQNSSFKNIIIKNALELIYDHYSWQGKLQTLDDELKSINNL